MAEYTAAEFKLGLFLPLDALRHSMTCGDGPRQTDDDTVVCNAASSCKISAPSPVTDPGQIQTEQCRIRHKYPSGEFSEELGLVKNVLQFLHTVFRIAPIERLNLGDHAFHQKNRGRDRIPCRRNNDTTRQAGGGEMMDR